jgi:L-Ala-D/L-Glu epimerase
MIIDNVEYQRYTIPFKVPFRTSHGLEQHRHGLIIKISDDNGLTGHGEAVSLPGFGTGSLNELEQWLGELVPRIHGLTLTDALALVYSFSPNTRNAPLRYALDTALLDIQAKEAGLPISKLIKPDAATSVPLNATISDMEAARAASAAYYAATAGYSTIKMKIGAFADPVGEVERVAAVREAIGEDTSLRLDVNGAWSIDQVIDIARKLEPYDIEYIEQPVPSSDIEAMAMLRKQISIPLAADEAAHSHDAITELIEKEAADTVIIKPAIVGGLKIARELVHLANSAGMRVVVTSSLESGVAITAALHLAATLEQPIPACGLATGALLETDLLRSSPTIEYGHMNVPTEPGLGVEPTASIWTTAN